MVVAMWQEFGSKDQNLNIGLKAYTELRSHNLFHY